VPSSEKTALGLLFHWYDQSMLLARAWAPTTSKAAKANVEKCNDRFMKWVLSYPWY
jgi:hypothetical protein